MPLRVNEYPFQDVSGRHIGSIAHVPPRLLHVELLYRIGQRIRNRPDLRDTSRVLFFDSLCDHIGDGLQACRATVEPGLPFGKPSHVHVNSAAISVTHESRQPDRIRHQDIGGGRMPPPVWHRKTPEATGGGANGAPRSPLFSDAPRHL